MRMRLIFSSALVTTVCAALAIEACGGDTETTPAEDAGIEAAVDAAPRDTGAPDTSVADAGPECDLSGNFLDDVPDAALADGATTSGICLGCLGDKCKTALDSCNADCNCREVVGELLECYAKGTPLVQCFFSVSVTPSQKTQQIGLQLNGCLEKDCNDECAYDELFDAGDGG
jgi:hypothetical protein